jgi:type IV secretion system protein VirB9
VVLGREGGDRAVWQVEAPANLPNMVFIKPTVLGSNSNITIVTNKHSYYFHVKSDKTLQANPSLQTYAIHFYYPQDAAKKAKALKDASFEAQTVSIDPNKHPEKYNWNYRFSGSPELAPRHVFDNGTFTYFELTKNQAVPAIFAVDDKQGKEAVVNARRMGDYLVVQRIAPQFTLRSGGITTSVFNGAEIERIKSGRRAA